MSDLKSLAMSMIEDLVEDNYLSVPRYETVTKIASLLYDSHSYEAVVTNHIPMLVTVRDLLKVTHPGRTRLSKIAVRPPTVSLETPVHDASLKLVQSKIRTLPVLRNGGLAGVLRQTKLLESMAGCDDLKEFFAEDLMTRNLFVARSDASASAVRSIMIRRGISHLPIIDHHGKLRGMIAASDLVWNFVRPRERVPISGRTSDPARHWNLQIRSLIDRSPLEATRMTRVLDIVRQMAKRKKGYCLVVEEDKPVGIITPREVIALLTAFRPKVEVPVYVVGFEDQGDSSLESAKAKIERVARRALKIHPELHEVVVHGRMFSKAGERRRFSVKARAYAPSGIWTVAAEGWSLLGVIDEICEKLDRRLTQA